MTNLTQVSANVRPGSTTTTLVGLYTAGEALVPGNTAYKKESDLKWYGGDANTAESAGSFAKPIIVLTPAGIDEPFVGVRIGPVNVGAVLAVGVRYAISATSKLICPESDLTTGDYGTSLGLASTTALLQFDPQVSGIVKP